MFFITRSPIQTPVILCSVGSVVRLNSQASQPDVWLEIYFPYVTTTYSFLPGQWAIIPIIQENIKNERKKKRPVRFKQEAPTISPRKGRDGGDIVR